MTALAPDYETLQTHLNQYVYYGLRDDQERANRALDRFIAAGGDQTVAHAALLAAYDAQAKPKRTRPVAPLRSPWWQAALLYGVLAMAGILVLYTLLGIGVREWQAWQSSAPAAEQEQPEQAPQPDASLNTRSGVVTRPAQPVYVAPAPPPAAPTYPFTLPAGTQGAWEPLGAPVADIGGRRYQDLGNGYVELDDGTRLWVVTERPAAPMVPPAAAEAAAWVQPVAEQAPAAVVPESGGSAAGAAKGVETVADMLLRKGK